MSARVPAPSTAPVATGGYLTAPEAARILGVKPHTLYTYVSRGLIRSVAQLKRKARLYYHEDIDKMRARAEAKHGQGAAAQSAMRWGQPVFNTGITEITAEGPRYRGRPALELAREYVPFEVVAELLWSGVLHHDPVRWEHEPPPPRFARLMDSVALKEPPLPMLRIFALATTLLGAAETTRSEIRSGTTIPAARQLILTLAGCIGYLARRPGFRPPSARHGIAAHLGRMFAARPTPDIIAAINKALVVCADHELSSSTFVARVAASTGAELRACVLAAIGSHSGVLLGGGCDRAEDLLRGVRTRADIRHRLASVEQSGARVPGFNLVLYPKGDPRARFLIELAQQFAPQSTRTQSVLQFIDEAEKQFELRPSIEVGMVALATALGLPERSAGALWALARTAGWIAHVMEQRLAGFVLRPRARYVSTA